MLHRVGSGNGSMRDRSGGKGAERAAAGTKIQIGEVMPACGNVCLDLPGRWPEVAAELEAEASTDALHERLRQLDPVAATRMEPSNRRRVVRALEVTIGSGRPFSSFGPGLETYPPVDAVLVGLSVGRDDLGGRITARFAAQLDAGFVDEVARLDARPEGWSRTAAQALGYRELLEHVRHGVLLSRCVDDAIAHTRRFAVRQDRWFRRDPRISWFDADRPDLVDAVAEHWSEWAGSIATPSLR
jgi:tRNA dimethylallyltransferase